MQPNERDAAYLWDMLEAARNIIKMVSGQNLSGYENDLVLRSAIERQVEILGEAANHVSSELQNKHPQIPWRQIIGQRNILAHEYKDVIEDTGSGLAFSHFSVLAAALMNFTAL